MSKGSRFLLFPLLPPSLESGGVGCQVLSIHLIQERRGVPGDGHGRALDHGAGRGARGQPLLLFPPLSLLLLQPLLGHLAPVDGSVAVCPARTRGQRGQREM